MLGILSYAGTDGTVFFSFLFVFSFTNFTNETKRTDDCGDENLFFKLKWSHKITIGKTTIMPTELVIRLWGEYE
jgi:hypothetical protein